MALLLLSIYIISYRAHFLYSSAICKLYLGVSGELCTYHLQNRGVAANNEGQTTETLDAMSDSYRQLLVEVLGTAL